MEHDDYIDAPDAELEMEIRGNRGEALLCAIAVRAATLLVREFTDRFEASRRVLN